MRVERELLVEVNEGVAMARAEARLRRAGYHPDPCEPGVFRRGTTWGSLFSSNPASIQTTITVLTMPVEGGSRVRTIQSTELLGQILTRDDMLFWRGELDALSDEIRTGEPASVDMSLARRAAVAGSRLQIASVLLPAPLAFVVGVALGSPLAMVVVYASLVIFCFVVGVGLLRRGMPTPHSLGIEAQREAPESFAPPLQEADEAQMALDDFDRRLRESTSSSPAESTEAEEEMKARLAQIAETVGRGNG